MENAITWLLIADASKARLFSMHKARFLRDQHPKNLELISCFTHEKSRMKGSELTTDKSGEFGVGTFVEATSPKTREAEEFALELLEHLESARKSNHYRDLIIVAPPAFMGMLHKHMPHQMHKIVSQNIEKDYTLHEGVELTHHLINHF
ncbi:MAG: host attachment protein [Gammaproteobacteria bacterium]|nr:host attachment protein [Gammaproteobacteria bacterium]MCW5584283.1 host attachment protein [Gammaproteobacteria bacterium]